MFVITVITVPLVQCGVELLSTSAELTVIIVFAEMDSEVCHKRKER